MYRPLQQATEKWSSVQVGSDSKNRVIVENHLSSTSNLNLNGFGSTAQRQQPTKNIGQEVNELILNFTRIQCMIEQRPVSRS